MLAVTSCRSASTLFTDHGDQDASAHAAKLHPPQFRRESAVLCSSARQPGSVITPIRDPESPADLKKPQHADCVLDADCNKGLNGRCLVDVQYFRGARVGAFARCSYDACVTDSDCPKPGVCVCRDSFGTRRENICVHAACITDHDCAGGNGCSPTIQATSPGGCRSEGQNFSALVCHTKRDACSDDTDCAGGTCVFSSLESRWICDSSVCLPD